MCREAGHGAGVLLRARRSLQELRLLCAGPGRLAQALGINARLNGQSLAKAPFELLARDAAVDARGEAQVLTGPRIGISKAVAVP